MGDQSDSEEEEESVDRHEIIYEENYPSKSLHAYDLYDHEDICCSNEDLDEDLTDMEEYDPYAELGITSNTKGKNHDNKWAFYLREFWTVQK